MFNIISPETSNLTFHEASNQLEEMFLRLHRQFVRPIRNEQKIAFIFNHESFKYAINTFLIAKKDMTVQMIKQRFMNIVQSYKDVAYSDQQKQQKFTLTVQVADLIKGGRKRKRLNPNQPDNQPRTSSSNEFEEHCTTKKSIRVVKNDDNFCLLRAIIVAKAYADKENNAYLLLRKNNKKMKKRLDKMCKDLNITNTQCGLNEVKKIEQYLEDYQIMIIDQEGVLEPEPLYLNETRIFKKHLYLSFTGNHFNVITSMEAFRNRSYYCHLCKVAYNNLGHHTCKDTCRFCKRFNCEANPDDENLKCNACGALTNNTECFKFHQERFCSEKIKCKACNKRKTFYHVCGEDERWCSNCKDSVPINGHECFIQKENKNKESNQYKTFIFFDYECYVDENQKHIPNLIMARKVHIDKSDITKYTYDPKKYTF